MFFSVPIIRGPRPALVTVSDDGTRPRRMFPVAEGEARSTPRPDRVESTERTQGPFKDIKGKAWSPQRSGLVDPHAVGDNGVMSNRRNHRRSASLRNRRNNYVPLMSWGCGRYCPVCFPMDRKAKIAARDERRHRTHAERLEAVEYIQYLRAAEIAQEPSWEQCGPDCEFCWGRSLVADLEKSWDDYYAREAEEALERDERALGDWMAASVDKWIEGKIREKTLEVLEDPRFRRDDSSGLKELCAD